MPTPDLRQEIKDALESFDATTVKNGSLELFKLLGYESEKTLSFRTNDADGFKRFLKDNSADPISEMKARTDEWKSIDFLFQLTDSEIKLTRDFFYSSDVDVSETRIDSYIFFAIELSADEYSRTKLAEITREINKAFPMPVMIIFRHGATITFSIIDRRLNKKDSTKDVLEKVTLIKDIRLAGPHRAHVEILSDLALGNLNAKNFVELHDAWQKVLDTKELNKKFFSELANWYFWATDNVEFPRDEIKKAEIRNPTNVIRLITRIIFVWFIKEKGLVPPQLFDRKHLDSILNFGDEYSSTYYKAILQNLFFATLNSEMNTREFRTEKSYKGAKTDFFVHNKFRYKSKFKTPDATLKELFEPIPFLNGGLFECLDREVETDNAKKIVRVDGFSDHKDSLLYVPDELFFSEEKQIDLNEAYGTKNKRFKVRGLINILDSYKFTITENTPIEEEIALDPELLGRVFENLLASYNPETKTTARKQTGSFYTPREIVNYMVDESLLAYLKQKLETETEGFSGYIAFGEDQPTMFGNEMRVQQKFETSLNSWKGTDRADELETALRELFRYSDEQHKFNETETEILIKAIDNCKILDPACGSGAFPMGILHRLVHLLGRLDPENKKWEQWQKQKAVEETTKAYDIGDSKTREDRLLEINNIFTDNQNDYGRKLFLIENCIYGVDIQPIAIQIAKLRFFISLIVDEKINRESKNLGIRPLPNLETKFVAANTLIGLEAQGGLKPEKINDLEKELKEVRAKHFSARTRKKKEAFRDKDKNIRLEIADLLKQGGIKPDIADQIASWNPYNQNATADWFDPEYMFSIKKGFDVVIGNPPYIGEKGNTEIFRIVKLGTLKEFYQRKMDIFYFFFHQGINLLKSGGLLTFITTNYYPTATAATLLRRDLRKRTDFDSLVNFNELKIFESALGQHNLITILRKEKLSNPDVKIVVTRKTGFADENSLRQILYRDDPETVYMTVKQNAIFEGKDNYIRLSDSSQSNPLHRILEKIRNQGELLGEICKVSQGILSGIDKIRSKHVEEFPQRQFRKGDGVFVLNKDEFTLVKGDKSIIKPWFKNSDIYKYHTNEKNKEFLIYATRDLEIEGYPDVYRHFLKYEDVVNSRSRGRGEIQAALKEGKWWVIFAARGKTNFNGEKIVAPQRSYWNTFGFNDVPWYASADVYYITRRDGSRSVNLKYILGLLNSKLYYLWLYNKGKRKGEMLELYERPLSEIPIKIAVNDTQNKIGGIVDRIIDIKKRDRIADTSNLEHEIDELTYLLYGLTDEEIQIVEGKV